MKSKDIEDVLKSLEDFKLILRGTKSPFEEEDAERIDDHVLFYLDVFASGIGDLRRQVEKTGEDLRSSISEFHKSIKRELSAVSASIVGAVFFWFIVTKFFS